MSNLFFYSLILMMVTLHLLGEEGSSSLNDLVDEIEVATSGLQAKGAEAQPESLEAIVENWKQMISSYSSADRASQSTILNYWNNALKQDELRWLQFVALGQNYDEPFMTEDLWSAFETTSSKLDLIPLVYIFSKNGDESTSERLLVKYKSLDDQELKRLVGQSRSWLNHRRVLKEDPDFWKNDIYSASKQPSPGPSFPAPRLNLSKLIKLYLAAQPSRPELPEKEVIEIELIGAVELEAVEEVKPSEPTIEEPAEVALVEVTEETPEQLSQWLVGAVVVIGGLGLVLSCKS